MYSNYPYINAHFNVAAGNGGANLNHFAYCCIDCELDPGDQ